MDRLSDLLDELHLEQVQIVAVARANHRALERLRRAGMLRPDGPLRAFPTINAAVTAFQRQTTQPTDEGPDPSAGDPPGSI